MQPVCCYRAPQGIAPPTLSPTEAELGLLLRPPCWLETSLKARILCAFLCVWHLWGQFSEDAEREAGMTFLLGTDQAQLGWVHPHIYPCERLNTPWHVQ